MRVRFVSSLFGLILYPTDLRLRNHREEVGWALWTILLFGRCTFISKTTSFICLLIVCLMQTDNLVTILFCLFYLMLASLLIWPSLVLQSMSIGLQPGKILKVRTGPVRGPSKKFKFSPYDTCRSGPDRLRPYRSSLKVESNMVLENELFQLFARRRVFL